MKDIYKHTTKILYEFFFGNMKKIVNKIVQNFDFELRDGMS